MATTAAWLGSRRTGSGRDWTPPWNRTALMRPTVAGGDDAVRSADREPLNAASPASRNLFCVDIRIGIANSPRELSFESSQTAAEVEKVVATALETDAKFIKLSDDKGRVYIVPTASFSYLEVGTDQSRRVGFVA